MVRVQFQAWRDSAADRLAVLFNGIPIPGLSTDQAYLRLTKELPRFHHPVAVVSLFTPSLFDRNLEDDRPHLGPGLFWLPPVQHWRLARLLRRLIHYRSNDDLERGVARTREILSATIRAARSRANDVAVVASNPSIAVAATDGGVFRTEDHGRDWEEITPAGPKHSTAVQVDRNRTDVVYASTDKLYKSTDSGSSWKGVNTKAKFLLVSPTDAATMYADLYSELAKSTNGGESWSGVFLGLGGYALSYYGGAVAIDEDPSNGNTLYIAAGDGALYRLAAARGRQLAFVPRRSSTVIRRE